MANELSAKFEDSAERAQQLSRRPSNESMLMLYGLYKQATVGDVSGKRPGFTDFVGRAKYDAWSKLKGKSSEDAMQAYIDLVDQLESE